VQGLPSQMSSLQSSNTSNINSPCPNGYYLRQGTCVAVSPSCSTYDSNTGECTSCINESYYLNQSNGACILISNICGYRTYFYNGNCLNVNNLCDQFDSTSGNCITCRDGSFLTADYQCIFNVSCGDRQYHAADSTCTNVSDKCGDYDQNTGECLSCISSYELNIGGICCYAFNYMISTQCVQFFSTNCLNQRPQFNYCLKCQTGYTLTNGVYGRCNLISNSTN
jgi:hypothetical protein